jgi:hypothetical protein
VGACCVTSLSPAMFCTAFATSSSILHVYILLSHTVRLVAAPPQHSC